MFIDVTVLYPFSTRRYYRLFEKVLQGVGGWVFHVDGCARCLIQQVYGANIDPFVTRLNSQANGHGVLTSQSRGGTSWAIVRYKVSIVSHVIIYSI